MRTIVRGNGRRLPEHHGVAVSVPAMRRLRRGLSVLVVTGGALLGVGVGVAPASADGISCPAPDFEVTNSRALMLDSAFSRSGRFLALDFLLDSRRELWVIDRDQGTQRRDRCIQTPTPLPPPPFPPEPPAPPPVELPERMERWERSGGVAHSSGRWFFSLPSGGRRGIVTVSDPTHVQ